MGDRSGDLGEFAREAAFRAAVDNYYAIDPRIQFAAGGVARAEQLDGLIRASLAADRQKNIREQGAIGWAALELGIMFDRGGRETLAPTYFRHARQTFEAAAAQNSGDFNHVREEITAYGDAPFALSCLELAQPQTAEQQREIAGAQYGLLEGILREAEELPIHLPPHPDYGNREKVGLVAEMLGAALASRAGYLVAPSPARQGKSTSMRRPVAHWDVSVWKIQDGRDVSFATPPDVHLEIKNRYHFAVDLSEYAAHITPVALLGDIFPDIPNRSIVIPALHSEVTNKPFTGKGTLEGGIYQLERAQGKLADIIEEAIANPRQATTGDFPAYEAERGRTPRKSAGKHDRRRRSGRRPRDDEEN